MPQTMMELAAVITTWPSVFVVRPREAEVIPEITNATPDALTRVSTPSIGSRDRDTDDVDEYCCRTMVSPSVGLK